MQHHSKQLDSIEQSVHHKSMSFAQIKETGRCFDLLIFEHPSLTSTIIKYASKLTTGMNMCNHVGLLLTDEVSIEGIDMSRPKVWESTVSNSNDPHNIDNDNSFGVQLRDLEEVVKNYQQGGGHIALCKLQVKPEFTDFQKIYDKYKHCKYATANKLVTGTIPALRLFRINDNSRVFCSEFVAFVYIDIKVITDATDGKIDGKILNPSNVIPTDFIGGDLDGMIPFTEEPIWIDKI